MLLIPPPPGSDRRVDENERCPGCGHRNGAIRFERIDHGSGKRVAMILHHCKDCQAEWSEEPVAAARWPAV
jgi:hypothetical protein